jgi:hypothetical protein
VEPEKIHEIRHAIRSPERDLKSGLTDYEVLNSDVRRDASTKW